MLALRKTFLALLLVAASACGKSPAVRHASNGDFGALGKELDDRAQKGDLDDAAVRDVARAILDHDLVRMSGDEGVRRVLALETCAKEIEAPLARTAKGTSDVAAAAALALVESGVARVDAFTDDHRDDSNPLWRAVATRGLVDASEGPLRLARSSDSDEHVRRAAVHAASDAGCASDFPLLLESMRKDPSVIVRVDAVRALAKIASRLDPVARAELVDRLRDVWPGGDDALRGAVARAWGSSALFGAGGRQQLEWAIGQEQGHATVDAASALMSNGGDGAIVLAKLATNGDAAVRAHALRLLDPSRSEHAKLLVEVAEGPKEGAGPDDASARVVAATALLRSKEHRDKALAILVSLLAREDKIGTDAALALAEEKDARAAPKLVKDLATPSFLRFRAVAGLVRLGKAAEARTLLASSDLDVRDGAACAVLATPRP